jgi:hypothetical protein
MLGDWHKAFAPELWSNWALAVIGVFGMWAALRTLRSIEQQTKVLVESQRPKLTASASLDPSKTLADPAARRVLIALENKGMTSAYDVFYEHWIEILPFPFEDFTRRADYFKCPHKMVLYPSEPMAINIPIQRQVSARGDAPYWARALRPIAFTLPTGTLDQGSEFWILRGEGRAPESCPSTTAK